MPKSKVTKLYQGIIKQKGTSDLDNDLSDTNDLEEVLNEFSCFLVVIGCICFMAILFVHVCLYFEKIWHEVLNPGKF